MNPTGKKIEKLKEALKKDFNNLYVKEFTTDWEANRIIRGYEIEVMSLSNLEKIIEVLNENRE